MRRIVLVALAVIAVALATDAFFIEPYDIEVTHTVLMARVNAPLKIAELTDLHTTKFGRLEKKLVDLLGQEKPDVIVITGDTLGRDSDYRAIRPLLQELHAPLGVWLVRGNWERNGIPRNEHGFYSSVGVHLLLNEAKPIRDDIWLVGVDDVITGNPDINIALKSVPPDVYAIALFHEPAYFDQVAGRVPLALAGHTHGGQVRIPFVPVFWLPRGSNGFLEGWYAERNSKMYVSRGIGTSNLPVRFMCRPELAIITLQPSQSPSQPPIVPREPSS
ncbi:MAG TPA: metallophosphoesterase [Candidatus Acidoferrales bacterium]|nr:metallophosphoesterase [Candidatus Acidoferrales bacterium]